VYNIVLPDVIELIRFFMQSLVKIAHIVATTENNVIGLDNQMPWHLPADLKHFKMITLGKPVLMGRKTFESIGRPLPDRMNIIITRNTEYQAEGCEVVHSVPQALMLAAKQENVHEIMMIGGANLYAQTLSFADRVYLTRIHTELEGDAFYPLLKVDEWKCVSSKKYKATKKNPHAYSFIQYDRKD